MNIHVEEPRPHHLHVTHSDLLQNLTARGIEHRDVSRLDMPTGLQPKAQLSVKDQEHLFVVGTENKRAGREVTWCVVVAGKRRLAAFQERQHAALKTDLSGVGTAVFQEQLLKVFGAVHTAS